MRERERERGFISQCSLVYNRESKLERDGGGGGGVSLSVSFRWFVIERALEKRERERF